jgi:hypothetical protein
MSTATTRRRPRVVVTPETAGQVSPEAERAGWAVCDVCQGALDPGCVVPQLPKRHPTCVPAKRSLQVVWGDQQ